MRISRSMLAKGTSYQTPYHIVRSLRNGPVMLISAGIHGNEIASIRAAQNIISRLQSGKIQLRRGTLIIAPIMNQLAYRKRIRGIPDLNRTFPRYASGFATHPVSAAWMKLARRYQPSWYLDLHEANGLSQVNAKYLGQTLITHKGSRAVGMAGTIIAQTNKTISKQAHHFNLRVKPLGGSARMALAGLGARAVTVETCWSLPLRSRIRYQESIVMQFLHGARML
ncbi:succinylglutamate desuccinylase/aspartoacylase family protein [Paenibacillus sanguinis]|uniref:succinylglutamate desuccinylase/aspartoacylase family protein n=1 Tax=Paenibacillus sanguinis TaxID=225906 RepID=UPI000367E01C|nr:succinylglutamate desuccinylase/aspartoacylase family protein [Paenibacillus sanguinis]